MPILGQSISSQGLSNDIDRPLPQSDKCSNQIFTMFTYLEGIMFRRNTYMSNFIYIYIFGGWQGCGERYAGLSELMFLNFIFKQPVKRLVKFPLEALIKDMAEEGKPYISW